MKAEKNSSGKLPPAVLWQERRGFLQATTRIPKLTLWSSLKKLLPLFQQFNTTELLKDVLSDRWYEHENFPIELRRALDDWATGHGYSDVWFKNIGVVQLHFWTVDPSSFKTLYIHVPSLAYSGFEDGVPPPTAWKVQVLEWRPYTGESWQDFAKRARKEFEVHLRAYRSHCLQQCPPLKHLRGYQSFELLAKFQAGLEGSKLTDSERKEISRVATRLQLTLRFNRTRKLGARKS